MIGVIYKIIVNCSSDKIYIGSTKDYKNRWYSHKSNYKIWKNRNQGYCSSFELFDKYGVDNCEMIKIKQYEVVDEHHLHALEQLWINKFKKKNINKLSAFVIDPVLKKIREEYMKKWYDANKQQKAEYDKKYNEKNKVRKTEQNKKWSEEIITCDICNLTMRRSSKSKHLKTKKHQTMMRISKSSTIVFS